MSDASLLSSVHGSLRQVLLAVPYWALRYGHQPEIRPYKNVYAALLGGLPDCTHRVVVTHAETESMAREWLADLGREEQSTVVVIPDGMTFTPWSQDASLVEQTTDGGVRLVAPAAFDRYDDANVLGCVAQHLGIPQRRSELQFQGGNVLVGDDFWLVGADAVTQTAELRAAPDPAAARAALAALDTGRRLHVIGTHAPIDESVTQPIATPDGARGDRWQEDVRLGTHEGSRQPMFDIDTFISLAGRGDDGRYRLLVGDPRLAAEITGLTLPDHAVADAFDEIAGQLASLGFQIVRNPLPLVHHDDPVLRKRRWYFTSANNVVLQIVDDDRSVWIPTYADDEHPELALTDARNIATWQGLGFDVHPLPSFHAFARGLGAAHCICKCLARTIHDDSRT